MGAGPKIANIKFVNPPYICNVGLCTNESMSIR